MRRVRQTIVIWNPTTTAGIITIITIIKEKIMKKNFYTNPFFVMAAALLCCALWGSATPFIKIGYSLILPEKNTASTILFAGIRFALAGILTVVIYSIA